MIVGDDAKRLVMEIAQCGVCKPGAIRQLAKLKAGTVGVSGFEVSATAGRNGIVCLYKAVQNRW